MTPPLTKVLRHRMSWKCAGIFAVVLLAYWPSLAGRIIWDDDAYVTREELRSLQGLGRIWTEVGVTEQYYPLLHSAFWVEHRLWGDATLGYHLLNVALHAACACLLALTLRRLAVPGAWVAALIFALHPVCVESVAWITEQKNTLSTLFYLLSLLAYLRFDRARGSRWYLLALVLFLLALLTKTVTATLPAALLVIFWWRQGSLSWKRDVLPLVPWLALGAAGGIFSGWVERVYIGAHGAAYDLSPVQRGLVAGRAAWFYLGKLFWPAPILFTYPRWAVDAGVGWQYLYPLGLLALVLALWLLRRRSRAPLAALLFFLGSLFPTIGFLNVYAFLFSYVADHWQYLPCLSVIALAGAGWARWTRSSPLVAVLVLGLLGTLTWRQSRYYRDAPTLYRATLDRNPAAWRIRADGADILLAQGRLEEAADQFRQVVAANPDYAESRNHLGDVYLKMGKLPEAVAQFEETVRLRPDATDARVNLGTILSQTGHLPEAIAQFDEALKQRPDSAVIHNNLGNALSQEGRLPEAIGHYEEAVRLRPSFVDARVNLANSLTRAARLPEALDQYAVALRLEPDLADGRYNWGMALAQAGRLAEAAEQFAGATKLAPDNALFWDQRGIVLAEEHRLAEAEACLRQALRLAPGLADAEANLGQVLLEDNQPREAIGHYENALRLDPGLTAVRPSLDRARALAGR
jgi:tetratricopeptide (TPR) repeat protein